MLNHKHYYVLGFALVAAMMVVAILLNPTSEFGGTDDGGGDVIEKIDPDYEPWFNSIWEPSAELSTLFFCLQTAIGSLIIGYFIGLNRGKGQPKVDEKKSA